MLKLLLAINVTIKFAQMLAELSAHLYSPCEVDGWFGGIDNSLKISKLGDIRQRQYTVVV